MNVVGVVPNVDAHAEPLEVFGVLAGAQIGTGHVELQRAQDLGQTTHANAANPDEVHVTHTAAEHQTASLRNNEEPEKELVAACDEDWEAGLSALDPSRRAS